MDEPLTVAISSRALFDLGQSNELYESEGLEAYRQYQIAHEEDILPPGEAFSFVRSIRSPDLKRFRYQFREILEKFIYKNMG